MNVALYLTFQLDPRCNLGKRKMTNTQVLLLVRLIWSLFASTIINSRREERNQNMNGVECIRLKQGNKQLQGERSRHKHWYYFFSFSALVLVSDCSESCLYSCAMCVRCLHGSHTKKCAGSAPSNFLFLFSILSLLLQLLRLSFFQLITVVADLLWIHFYF